MMTSICLFAPRTQLLVRSSRRNALCEEAHHGTTSNKQKQSAVRRNVEQSKLFKHYSHFIPFHHCLLLSGIVGVGKGVHLGHLLPPFTSLD